MEKKQKAFISGKRYRDSHEHVYAREMIGYNISSTSAGQTKPLNHTVKETKQTAGKRVLV